MEAVQHNILRSQPSGMTPRRALIIGGVGLLHVAAIWGLMNGMVAKAIQVIEKPIVVTVDTKQPPVKPAVLPPTPPMQQPPLITQTTVPPPDIVVDNNEPSTPIYATPTLTNPPTPVPDTSAAGLSNTHTVPPYPVSARALSHQGTVTLQMVVTAQGDVANASVITSSGFAELDQAAIDWVVSHWKYRPAIQNGAPVPSQTTAAVKFDLKTASR